MSIEDLVKGPLPQFGYQLHLASGEVEKSVNDEQSIRQFLSGMYGGRGPNGELVFDPAKGVLVENLPLIGESSLVNGTVRDDNLLFLKICHVGTRLDGEEMVKVDRGEGSSIPEDERSTDAFPYLVLLALSGKSPIGSPEDRDVRHEHHLINRLHRDLPPADVSSRCRPSLRYSL
jgi:hypothetical protein